MGLGAPLPILLRAWAQLRPSLLIPIWAAGQHHGFVLISLVGMQLREAFGGSKSKTLHRLTTVYKQTGVVATLSPIGNSKAKVADESFHESVVWHPRLMYFEVRKICWCVRSTRNANPQTAPCAVDPEGMAWQGDHANAATGCGAPPRFLGKRSQIGQPLQHRCLVRTHALWTYPTCPHSIVRPWGRPGLRGAGGGRGGGRGVPGGALSGMGTRKSM